MATTAWEQYSAAEALARHEANLIGNIYHVSYGVAEPPERRYAMISWPISRTLSTSNGLPRSLDERSLRPNRCWYAHALSLLPPNSVLVNVARGSLIDEDALYHALTSGQLFAAGLDVFRDEPDFDMRFAGLDNVVLSPHVGSASKETRDAMGYRALDNIAAVLDGRPAIDSLWRD